MRILIKILGTVLCLVWVTSLANAQFGISFQQYHWDANNWEAIVAQNDSADLAQKNLRFGAHYWFRLKNLRIEFLPEISYMLPLHKRLTALEGQMEALSGQVMIDIYPFDLKSDCNCPTFSKQGDALQKGFFLELAPGVQWNNLKLLTRNDDQTTGTRLKTNNVSFRIAAGAGLDLGISDFLTITPWIQGVWLPAANWEGLAGALYVDQAVEDEISNVFGVGYGIRFQLRPDYK